MRVPKFQDPELAKFITEFVRDYEDYKKQTLSLVAANRSLLLISPSKKTYEVTISDAGALTVMLVQG